jgi:choline dehydrogenase-like flavoprotein
MAESFTGSSRLRRLSQAGVILLLVLCVTGCTRLLYNRLDTLAGWYLESLVELDDQQRGDLRSWLDQTLEWHRQSELTRYAQFLRDLAAESAQPGTRASYERIEQRIESFGTDLVNQAAPSATELLLSLTPEQIDELTESLEEKSIERNADDQEAIEDGTWAQRQTRSTQKQLKRWTGAVTSAQKQQIQDTVAALEPANSDWLESLKHWRAALRTALSSSESREATEQRVVELLRAPDSEWTEDYRAKSNRNRERFLDLLGSLDTSLTAAQRSHLQRELIELAQQLESLKED